MASQFEGPWSPAIPTGNSVCGPGIIVEVIAVGTELLIGQIANTNASFIGARLAEEGFDAHYQVTVGDTSTGWSRDRAGLALADALILPGNRAYPDA